MRAVVMRRGKLIVDTIPDPVPGPGEVLVKTLACGICGSDLHTLLHGERLVDASRRSDGLFVMDLDRDVVLGHEFCAEVVEHGPDTQKALKPGTRVCSVPVLLRDDRLLPIGYSNDAPGGFAEYLLLNELLLLEVPDGLSNEKAALTEPLAVGWHAVQKAGLTPDDVPLVIGCGPVGLSVVAALRSHGAGPIVAADFCAMRRRIAQTLGADVVVDPAESSPYKSWEQAAAPENPIQSTGAAALLDSPLKPAVIFECVGVPGVIQHIFEGAPRNARIVVAGVCMEQDRFEPMLGINKELNVQFVLGYTPEEFAACLNHLAEGRTEAEAMITGKVGLTGLPGAFEELANPDRQAKVLVEPWRD